MSKFTQYDKNPSSVQVSLTMPSRTIERLLPKCAHCTAVSKRAPAQVKQEAPPPIQPVSQPPAPLKYVSIIPIIKAPVEIAPGVYAQVEVYENVTVEQIVEDLMETQRLPFTKASKRSFCKQLKELIRSHKAQQQQH